jgi:phytoene dehydrogenase-like protein
MATEYDAVVVGSGPNGLGAAITLAEAGRSVLVLEGAPTPGGGMRTEELTLPGFRHDVCSAIHPMAALSPVLRNLDGLEWAHPEIAVAHPLDDGTAAAVHRSLDTTAAELGPAWRRVFGPLVADPDGLTTDVLGPQPRVPRHPTTFLRFASRAALPATAVDRLLGNERAAAAWAGIAAHAITRLSLPLSAAPGMMLAAAGHIGGWPAARGGSASITDALVRRLESLGGVLECGHAITDLGELPKSGAYVLDMTPWQLAAIAGDRLPAGTYRRFRHASASFKIDYALDGPVPWTAEAPRRAGTVHLGGTAREVEDAERAVHRGRVPNEPLVLVTQQSLFDTTRAPDGKHTLWAYCHVPFGCEVDMTGRIEGQLDRFAPGWRDRVLAKTVSPPSAIERHTPNAVGGDIAGGGTTGLQLVFRPRIATDPYATPIDGVWLCSSSTPPGAGVHGMCGLHAARSVLRARR